MSFYDIYIKNKDFPDANRLLSLLSKEAEDYLEEMAQEAHQLTVQNFGKTIQLYTPMYISNYCDNWCIYCGFNAKNDIERKKLTIKEVGKEALFIASWGLKHILLLCGESREMAPLSYIKECVRVLRKYFSSIAIEIYALTEEEYGELIDEGVDGLVIYQEVYDEKLYKELHPKGPKKDFLFRLEAPERAAKRGMRTLSIGALLGLNKDWRKEAFFTGLHAKYLQDNFPSCEISVSIPRLRPENITFKPQVEFIDKNLVQIILALRIFLPRVGITLSTREKPLLREHLIPLGITRMSAGSTTIVGGHTAAQGVSPRSAQFEICDKRSVDEIKEMISAKGYQPVLKDW